MRCRIILTVVALFLTLANGPCEIGGDASCTISGMVEDVGLNGGIGRVEVSWNRTVAVTDDGGKYSLSLPAGIRKIVARLHDGRSFFKVIRIENDQQEYRLDFLIPNNSTPDRKWVIEMKPPLDSEGNPLDSDFSQRARLWITDFYLNDPEPVPTDHIAGNHVSPRWSPAGDVIAFAAQTLPSTEKLQQNQGIWFYDPEFRSCNQVVNVAYPFYLDWHPNGRALVVASQTGIRIVELNLKNPDTPPKRIFSITPEQGILLSVCWPSPDRILATWDGPVTGAIDPIRQRTSRIVQLNPDLEDQEPVLYTEPGRSVRYPIASGPDGEIVYTSFVVMSPEGRIVNQPGFPGGGQEVLLEHGTHPVWWSSADGTLVFLEKRDLYWKKGANGTEKCLMLAVISAHLSPEK